MSLRNATIRLFPQKWILNGAIPDFSLSLFLLLIMNVCVFSFNKKICHKILKNQINVAPPDKIFLSLCDILPSLEVGMFWTFIITESRSKIMSRSRRKMTLKHFDYFLIFYYCSRAALEMHKFSVLVSHFAVC